MIAYVRVRVEQFDRIASEQGLRTRYALAKHLGASQSTIGRVLDGDQAPGEQFIAAALVALDVKFEDVFEVIPETSGEGAAA